jgi:hypothetical protein
VPATSPRMIQSSQSGTPNSRASCDGD